MMRSTRGSAATASRSLPVAADSIADSTDRATPETEEMLQKLTEQAVDERRRQGRAGWQVIVNHNSRRARQLSIVQIRQDFSKNLINVLQTRASNLTLADTNAEAASSQALSTRQPIAVCALALANQSQQSVLQRLR
jgi:hypothetical protein